jgi:hypothetical protein
LNIKTIIIVKGLVLSPQRAENVAPLRIPVDECCIEEK